MRDNTPGSHGACHVASKPPFPRQFRRGLRAGLSFSWGESHETLAVCGAAGCSGLRVGFIGGQSDGLLAGRSMMMMGKRIFSKTVEIHGAAVSLLSLDARTWSSNLKDLKRFETERAADVAIARRMMKRIGNSERWGMSQGRRQRAG